VKTSKADFEYFKRRYLFHLRELGINNFEIRFMHEDADEAYATTLPSTKGMCATVTLSMDWENGDGRKVGRRELDFSARHEVLHLLLCKLSELAGALYAQGIVDGAEEEIIRTLENYLDRKGSQR
jgi:hypothetical protein